MKERLRKAALRLKVRAMRIKVIRVWPVYLVDAPRIRWRAPSGPGC